MNGKRGIELLLEIYNWKKLLLLLIVLIGSGVYISTLFGKWYNTLIFFIFYISTLICGMVIGDVARECKQEGDREK